MKALRPTLCVIALAMLVAAWFFYAQKTSETPAPTLTLSKKTTAPGFSVKPMPVAVQTPKIGPTVPIPADLAATSKPATELDDYNMNVPVIGPAPMPVTPGPTTEWGEVHFEDGEKVELHLVTGQPVTITPKILSNGDIELNALVKYPTDKDIMVLRETAKPGEEVTLAIDNMDVKLTPTSN